ncbi:hypothetical protein [Anaeromyxobacter paludicola]|uniref:Uncharacterized protein n=1 Tax=Anaeromyxobacter paludicola TaxID=2918171 RepID=A0ABM7XC29_9BACT|nr:hypothetical protein [Anaeromyxobacter paludicola]BDG09417.1 hypothetical protein AMPC_25300 [Anaeromyxobacter paludicola]
MPARVLRFALEDLRRAFGGLVPAGTDPRHDTRPFRAFRAALLEAAAAAAVAPAALGFWWEGSYNGYWLAVSVEPPEAIPGPFAERACPVDDERLAPPRPDRYPLAAVSPGAATVARDEAGAAYEAPFGAPTGHFGAPGVRRIT